MMQGLFSKRLKEALDAKKIPYPSFSRTVRRRLGKVCREHCESGGSFDDAYHTELDTMHALEKAYGVDTLMVQGEMANGQREADDLYDFIVYAYPHCVLDAMEAFYRLLSDDTGIRFQREINGVLTEEDCPWRVSDGHVYLVDSRYLDALKDQAEEDMNREGFLGAHEEFQDARTYLQAGDADDAIHKANCAFESALQSLLNVSEGTADDLLKNLRSDTDLLSQVPEATQKIIVSRVLLGLPLLRNKIGGHGQGEAPAEIPHGYGDLAINLAASYIKFLLDIKKELEPPKQERKAVAADIPGDDFDDDIPF